MVQRKLDAVQLVLTIQILSMFEVWLLHVCHKLFYLHEFQANGINVSDLKCIADDICASKSIHSCRL